MNTCATLACLTVIPQTQNFCVETAKSSLKLIFIISSVHGACMHEFCGSFYECLHMYLFLSGFGVSFTHNVDTSLSLQSQILVAL